MSSLVWAVYLLDSLEFETSRKLRTIFIAKSYKKGSWIDQDLWPWQHLTVI